MHMVKVTGAIVALGIALAGCGGGGGGSMGSGATTFTAPVPAPTSPAATPTSAPTTAPSGAPGTVTGFAGDTKQAQINGQTILVDASTGLALYFFDGDGTDRSNCTAANGCLAIWPSHAATAGEKASGNFSIFTRSDGTGMQWAYKGRPLYTFVSDSPAHNATGNNFQNFVLATP